MAWAFFSNRSMSILLADTLPALVCMFNLDGAGWESTVTDDRNGLLGVSDPPKFNLSKASNSASENCRVCLGLNGTGVDTRDVKNCRWSVMYYAITKGHP